jgi:hypothetical protein
VSGPPHEPAVLLAARSSVEAHGIVALLAEAGVEASVLDVAHLGAGTPLAEGARRVPVRVRSCDLDRARALVAAGLADSAGIDWETLDVGPRADALPLRAPGRMPLPARIAFVVTALVALTGLVAGVIALFL